MRTVDGSRGEGGGQLLRTALSVAAATGTGLTLENIRAARPRPGLRAQHLAAVRAAASIADAEVDGAEIGSRRLRFVPSHLRGGTHEMDVGTAGSATLVAQTVLVPLLSAPDPSRVVVIGGTHNRRAPPFEFLEEVFLSRLRAGGADVNARLGRHGFEPAGGGRIEVAVTPSSLGRYEEVDRGEITDHGATVLLANLPPHIAERELAVVDERLGWDPGDATVRRVDADSPGNVLLLRLSWNDRTELFAGFGRRGLPAEDVAAAAADRAESWIAAGAPVGPRLADQLLLPLALHEGGTFAASAVTRHLTTNAALLRDLLGTNIDLEAGDDGSGPVTVRVDP